MKSTFDEHQRNEIAETLIDAWKYLKPHQKMWLYIRAMWWSMPSILDRLERLNQRVNNWFIYRSYKAHWM